MNIIKQNPFRILGLAGNTTEKELQRQIGIIKRYAEVGKTKSFDYDFEFIGDFTRNSDEIQQASNSIEQAHKKLFYSLFWFVKNTPFDEIAFNNMKDYEIGKAIEIWDKTLKEEITSRNYSSYLNLSTLYIVFSTIDNQIHLQILKAGISLKGNLIHSENLKDLSKLVTGNGVASNPIDISKKFVDEVIELLKPYLNKRNGISTKELISLFNNFPTTIKKYVSTKFTEVPISNIENKIEKTTRKRKSNPQNADKYAEELYKTTKSDITLLKKLMGTANLQFQLLADKVANEILQCSVDFFNDRQKNDSDDNFEINLNKAIELVKLAKSVAINSQVKQRANENIETLNGMRDRSINKAIAILGSIKSAYEKAVKKIDAQVFLMKMKMPYGQTINYFKVEELKEDCLNWSKLVDMVVNEISLNDIEKIKQTNDTAKLKEYESLVDFFIGKLKYLQIKKVKYLAYWKSESVMSKIQFIARHLPIWVKWIGGISAFLLIIFLIWGMDGLKVLLMVFLGILFLLGIGQLQRK